MHVLTYLLTYTMLNYSKGLSNSDQLTNFHMFLLARSKLPDGFYSYTWWAQLAPSQKWGGSYVECVNQNSPPIFHFTIYTVNKTHLLFFTLHQ